MFLKKLQSAFLLIHMHSEHSSSSVGLSDFQTISNTKKDKRNVLCTKMAAFKMQKKSQWSVHSGRLLQGISNEEKRKSLLSCWFKYSPISSDKESLLAPCLCAMSLSWQFHFQWTITNIAKKNLPLLRAAWAERQTGEGMQTESRLITPIERWLFHD